MRNAGLEAGPLFADSLIFLANTFQVDVEILQSRGPR